MIGYDIATQQHSGTITVDSKLGAFSVFTVDALSEYGVRHIDMPATPFRVWQAIRAARGAG
jgi:hypothetical protein